MDDYISSGAKSTSGVWLERVTGMTTTMKFIFKKFLLTCNRCGSIRINVRRVLIVSLMLLMLWIIMPYLQSLFCIVWQVPLFPFCRCINRGTERFRHVFNVAYRVSSEDILEPQFPNSRSSCSHCLPQWHTPCSSGGRSLQENDRGLQFPVSNHPSALCESARGATHSETIPKGCVLSSCTRTGGQRAEGVPHERDFHIFMDLDLGAMFSYPGLAGIPGISREENTFFSRVTCSHYPYV